MSLNPAVKDARRPIQRIKWEREDETIIDLTGLTLSGVIEDKATGTQRAIDGTLSQVPGVPDEFYWTWGSTDVGTVGRFRVRFKAEVSVEVYELSYWMDWSVSA